MAAALYGIETASAEGALPAKQGNAGDRPAAGAPVNRAAAERGAAGRAAAERALAEAEARRRERRDAQAAVEVEGRGGLEPVRYGDWEVKGLASDF